MSSFMDHSAANRPGWAGKSMTVLKEWFTVRRVLSLWTIQHARHPEVGWLKRCFTFTETVGLLGTGAQDVHLDFHTAPEFCKIIKFKKM